MKGASIKVFKTVGLIVGVAVLVAVSLIAIRWNAPPLRLRTDNSHVSVDVSTLGEYPTTVTRIRLSDVSDNTVVWEVTAETATVQIHGFGLHEGYNRALIDTDSGSYQLLVPTASDSFVLQRGKKYRLDVWGGRSVLSRRSAVFYVGGSR